VEALSLETIRAAIRGAADFEASSGLYPVRPPRNRYFEHPDSGITWMARYSSGVRLELTTPARHLELDTAVHAMPGTVPVPIRVAAEAGGEVLVTEFDPPESLDGSARVTWRIALPASAATRPVTVWLPLDAAVEIFGARTDLPASPTDAAGPVWLHHGSSISHGMEAANPAANWPHQAARRLGMSITDRAFSGQALLDPFVARAIAADSADVITLKLGINVINTAAMRERAFIPALHGFLDLVREGHPEVPICLISAIWCPLHETVPGPTVVGPDGRLTSIEQPTDGGVLTLRRTRELLQAAVAARGDDPHLYYQDGLALLDHDDEALLYDRLHPDQAGLDLIASRFATLARERSSGLGSAFATALAGVR
jgi:hypothetical protein